MNRITASTKASRLTKPSTAAAEIHMPACSFIARLADSSARANRSSLAKRSAKSARTCEIACGKAEAPVRSGAINVNSFARMDVSVRRNRGSRNRGAAFQGSKREEARECSKTEHQGGLPPGEIRGVSCELIKRLRPQLIGIFIHPAGESANETGHLRRIAF